MKKNTEKQKDKLRELVEYLNSYCKKELYFIFEGNGWLYRISEKTEEYYGKELDNLQEFVDSLELMKINEMPRFGKGLLVKKVNDVIAPSGYQIRTYPTGAPVYPVAYTDEYSVLKPLLDRMIDERIMYII